MSCPIPVQISKEPEKKHYKLLKLEMASDIGTSFRQSEVSAGRQTCRPLTYSAHIISSD